MKMKNILYSKRCLGMLLCLAMIISIVPANYNVAQAASRPKNPRIQYQRLELDMFVEGITTWDCIYFGNYYQNNSSTKEKIKWRVLSVKGDTAFLLADQALDYKVYNEEGTNVTWETCTLRKWLNNEFYNTAFNSSEQAAIKTVKVIDESYYEEDIKTTLDKIFLLSLDELMDEEYGFDGPSCGVPDESETRGCKPTIYTQDKGCYTWYADKNDEDYNDGDEQYNGNCYWWLRWHGNLEDSLSFCEPSGHIFGSLSNLGCEEGVRPALKINLASSSWSNAGTVSAKNDIYADDEEDTPNSSSNQPSGYVTIGDNQSGAADSNSGVSKVFPASWALKSTKYPLELSQTQNADNTYTIKGSIGVGRSDLLNKDSEWSKYKKACDKANKTAMTYDKMSAYRDLFGIESNTVIHSDGWKGSKKPELSVMGYIEFKFDAYGNLINASGSVAGELAWKGGITWDFLTPVGPMYLKLEPGCKLKLAVTPNWYNQQKKLYLEGSLTITPSISVTGAYGLDGIASVGATGSLSLPIDIVSAEQDQWRSKGVLSAEASVNAYALFAIDYTWKLATYQKTLWNAIVNNSGRSNVMAKPVISVVKKPKLMSTKFAKKTTKWSGNVKSVESNNSKILQSGILKSSRPITAQIGDKEVMVWQAYDPERSVVNSSVLMYSVLQGDTWSTPKAVLNDGYGDSYADMQVIDGQLYLAWQKQKKVIDDSDIDSVMQQMGENSEIYLAKFNSSENTFGAIKQITDNDECDMLPQFVENAGKVAISYINNDNGDLLQKSGNTTIKCFDYGSSSTKDIVEVENPIGVYLPFQYEGNTHVVYSVHEEDDSVLLYSTYDDYNDYLEELSYEDSQLAAGSMNYHDGIIDIIYNGELYQYDLSSNDFTKETAGDATFDNNATFVTNGTKSAYVWSSYDEEAKKGCIKAALKDEEGHYCEPITLFDTKDSVARFIAANMNNAGDWSIIVNQENIENKMHSLVAYGKDQILDSSLLSAEINSLDEEDGETAIDFELKNEGDVSVDVVTVTVKSQDGTEVSRQVQVDLAPGAMIASATYMDLTAFSKGQKVSISVKAENESMDEENTVWVQLAKTDMALIGKATEQNGVIKVTATVENKGEENGSAKVCLYKDAEKSSVLAEEQSVNVAVGETTDVNFSVLLKDIVYNEKGAAYLPLCVDTAGGDYNEDDNVIYMALYRGQRVNVDTTPVKSEKIILDEKSGNIIPVPTPTPMPPVQNITLSKVKKLKAKSARKALKLSWKNVSGATGYEIQYSLKKNFKKSKKITIKKGSTKSKTIKKLKKKKKYYIRIRAYAIYGSKKICSFWTKTSKKTK